MSTQQPQQPSPSHNSAPSLHPQFQAKAVCRLTCKSCLSDVCMRGMKAILLADARVELYSTDRPPVGVQLVYDDYRTRNCKCRIRDVACLGCGNTLGYHVTQPCESCLEACNNGHFWMFHSDGVSCTERYLPKTSVAYRRMMASIQQENASHDNRGPRRRGSTQSDRSQDRVRRFQEESEPDRLFRRRTSIHDIEYNSAVNAGATTSRRPSSASATLSSSSPTDLPVVVVAQHSNDQERSNDDDDDDDDDVEDLNCSDDDENDSDDGEESDFEEDEEDVEEEEEKPVLMLWAALHDQEERYLQQMQQQLLLHQQQQAQLQQRLQMQLQQQQERERQERVDAAAVAATVLSTTNTALPGAGAPTVGSRYHSMISSAISNASMTLWDEGRSLNPYEQLCR
ncbi:Protein fam72a [Gryganskiella cystojenkinii]|nr:Protein fam72a [Gryganskiella cystojenkinii]